MENGLRASGITITFAGVDVVKSVDLELRFGEIHAIVGENGAGKSSLAKAIAGVYQPRLGTVELEGHALHFKNPRQALEHGIALIHQEPLTFPDLDVTENIFAGHHPRRGGIVDWRSAYQKARELLDSLHVDLNPFARVGGLSVAMQQRVELAAALSHDAKIWIFDETTAPLTPKEVGELFTIMRGLRERGCALAMVTHRLQEVFDLADRITILRDGEKVAEKIPLESSIPEVVRLMVGRELAEERFEASGAAGAPVVEATDLTGAGFERVTLEIKQGEILGMAGLVGAGRTEFARALFGIVPASSGEIKVAGQAVRIGSPRQAQSLGIALVPEDRRQHGLFLPQSISFNATLVWLKNLSSGGILNRAKQEDAAESYARQLKLVHRDLAQPVVELSGGNQQKVVLSKWLMTGPKLLILDEPTRGVDVGAKHEVHKAIRELADQGLAVLMISSDLPEVLALSDRIAVMREGRLVATMAGKGATEEQIMFAAAGQEAAHV